MTDRRRLGIVAAFAAVYVIWGSTYLAIAWAVEAVPPLLMIGGRCLVAGAVLYGWARARGGRRPTGAEWRSAAVAGVLLFVTGQAVLAWTETRIPSGAASLLIATEPLFIALLAWRGRWLTGESGGAPSRGALVAVVVGLVGVAVLVGPDGGEGRLDPLGAVAAVAAAFSWSVGVFRARPQPGLSAGQVAGMQLLVAATVLLAVVLAGPLVGSTGVVLRLTPRAVAAFLYLVVFGSIVTFAAYVWLLVEVGPARLSSHGYVNPLVAVALGVVLNEEPLTPGLLVAAALILGSVAALLRSRVAGGGGRVVEASAGSAEGAQVAKPARPNRQRAARNAAAEIARSQT